MEWEFRGKAIRQHLDYSEDTGRDTIIANINEWVYGYFHKEGDASYITNSDMQEIHVISATVGLFTGLTDKNGVKIFEGDTVNGTMPNSEVDEDFKNAKVKWIECGFAICDENEEYLGSLISPVMNNLIEVIHDDEVKP
jgi:hypothetical protein